MMAHVTVITQIMGVTVALTTPVVDMVVDMIAVHMMTTHRHVVTK
jgi:hypothetical protein